jgi:predicted DsbA family dithiol-disulfide isomerase
MNIMEIMAFTDPVCTWCWGSEPVLRALEASYGDALRIRPVMGGLVRDIREFYDSANAIGGDPDVSNAQIVRHWLDASARHGMPVRADGFRLFSTDVVSTYPQNIAVKAAELTDAARGGRFLRRIREASAAEARETGRRDVLIELADEVGLDVAAFILHLDDGSAERAFREDLDTTRRYQVHGFPTFLLRYDGQELMLRGYKDLRAMQAVIASMTRGELRSTTPASGDDDIVAFLRASGRAAPVELATVFGWSGQEGEATLAALEAAGRIRYEATGNGGFWRAVADGAGCDAQAGLCALDA